MKSMLLITHSIDDENRRQRLASRIGELFDSTWHGLERLWVVVTDMTAAEVRDELKRVVEPDDQLFVAMLSGHAVWNGIHGDSQKWLLKHL